MGLPKAIFTFFMVLLVLSVDTLPAEAQTPFVKKRQVFLLFNDNNSLVDLSINPSNNSMLYADLNGNLGFDINSLGFSKTEAFLYGIAPTSHQLFRIDANGMIELMYALNLNAGNEYLAGDVTPDGQFLVAIGSANGISNSLVKIDLTDPDFGIENLPMGGNRQILDLAFDPITSIAYAYDGNNKEVITVDINTGATTVLGIFDEQNDGFGLYFNAFGELFIYGSTIFGIIDALFAVDKTTGNEFQIATGPVMSLADMASCPYAVEIRSTVALNSALPCSEIEYEYTIANQSGEMLTGIDLQHQLPEGFNLLAVLENPLGGIQDITAAPSTLLIENITIPQGIFTVKILVEIGDIPADEYNSQTVLMNLPPELGSLIYSDDPNTTAFEDSTFIEVIRIEEDSIYTTDLVCEGESLVLDASTYGNNILWNNGSTDLQLEVDESGVYFFDATSGCQSVFVSYEITVATCPFTISLDLVIDPAETLPCSEVVYRFEIDNDSGGERVNIGLVDTLPDGFKLLEVLNNPYGGQLKADLPDNVIDIEGMTLHLDQDYLEFLVEIGDVSPGIYQNRGKLYNLPNNIGMFRFSDDPATQPFDSTGLQVFGTGSDTLYLVAYICEGEILNLDVSQFGIDYIWSTGSTESNIMVSLPGNYDVVLFNGCDPTYVFYTVKQAPALSVHTAFQQATIFQSEYITFNLDIHNEDDSLAIYWNDVANPGFSCQNCQTLTVQPIVDTEYGVLVANEFCTDSLTFLVEVDEERRIFAPNVFSPNGDGFNDVFYLQSPDFGILKYLKIFDRWGNLIYQTDKATMNNSEYGWDGGWGQQISFDGVFVWEARIEFFDGTSGIFSGSIAILR